MGSIMKMSLLALAVLACAGTAVAPPRQNTDNQESPEILRLRDEIRGHPDSAVAFFNLGQACVDGYLYEEAVGPLEEAMRINPNYPEAAFFLAMAYDEVGRSEASIQMYKEAVRLCPDYYGAYFNLGLTYQDLGRYQEAAEAFEQAARTDEEDGYVRLHLAQNYLRQGLFKEARKAVRAALRLEPDINLNLPVIPPGLERELLEPLIEEIRTRGQEKEHKDQATIRPQQGPSASTRHRPLTRSSLGSLEPIKVQSYPQAHTGCGLASTIWKLCQTPWATIR